MIRKATHSDVASLSILIHEAWQKDLTGLVAPEASSLFSIDWFASRLELDLSRDFSCVIVYEKNNNILGYAAGKYSNDTLDSELFGLYVSPDVQKSGIGSQLFQEMKSTFVSLKKSNMIVWTLLGAPNNKFYMKQKPREITSRDINISSLKYNGIGYIYSL